MRATDGNGTWSVTSGGVKGVAAAGEDLLTRRCHHVVQ